MTKVHSFTSSSGGATPQTLPLLLVGLSLPSLAALTLKGSLPGITSVIASMISYDDASMYRADDASMAF